MQTIHEDIVSQIRQALAASSTVIGTLTGATTFPSLLINRPDAFKSWKLKGENAADSALC